MPCAESGISTLVRLRPFLRCAGAHHQDAGELAVRPCHRLRRNARQARDLGQQTLQLIDHVQRTLGRLFRLHGMQLAEARQRSHVLVQARVVFHGARAQRIELAVYREIALGEAREVTHHVQLAHLGQVQLCPLLALRHQVG